MLASDFMGALHTARGGYRAIADPLALGRFVADEAQHGQIAVPLVIRQSGDAHVIARDRDKEGIGEMEIRVAQVRREIVAQSQRQGEAVEALGDEHGQVLGPERLVAVPALILHVTGKDAQDAANLVGRLLQNR